MRCLSWEPGEGGTRAVLDVLGERCELVVPLRAAHHAANLAAAAARLRRVPACRLTGIAEGAAGDRALALPRAGASAARGGVLVNDAYNANPASMESALAALVERAGGARTVAVLGHMAELGPGRAALARRGGARLRAARHRRRDRRR